MSTKIQIHVEKEKIAQFCQKWRVKEFALFGSVLRDDFRPDSDIDVLVTFTHDANWRIEDLLDMKESLEALFGRSVDLVERRLVEESKNYIRRKHILSPTRKLYMLRDEGHLLDMLQAAQQICEYTQGMQKSDFLKSRRDQDAVQKGLVEKKTLLAVLANMPKQIAPATQVTLQLAIKEA